MLPMLPVVTLTGNFKISGEKLPFARSIILGMLKKIAVISLPVFLLAGCSIEEVAQTASDAAACTALQSALGGLSEAYQSGLVDSGIISEVDALVGDQLDALLSTGLAEDLALLSDALATSNTGESAQQTVDELTASINERCSAVGVNIE